jgi:hypothetical protein
VARPGNQHTQVVEGRLARSRSLRIEIDDARRCRTDFGYAAHDNEHRCGSSGPAVRARGRSSAVGQPPDFGTDGARGNARDPCAKSPVSELVRPGRSSPPVIGRVGAVVRDEHCR